MAPGMRFVRSRPMAESPMILRWPGLVQRPLTRLAASPSRLAGDLSARPNFALRRTWAAARVVWSELRPSMQGGENAVGELR